jgi:hypothetical protein
MARSLRWLRGVKAGLTSRGRGSGFAGAAEGRGRRLGARRGRRAALDWGHVALPGSAGLGWVGVKGDPGEGEQADTPFVTPCTRLVHTSLHGALRPALARPLAPWAVRHRRSRPMRRGGQVGRGTGGRHQARAAAGAAGGAGARRGGRQGRGQGRPPGEEPGQGPRPEGGLLSPPSLVFLLLDARHHVEDQTSGEGDSEDPEHAGGVLWTSERGVSLATAPCRNGPTWWPGGVSNWHGYAPK